MKKIPTGTPFRAAMMMAAALQAALSMPKASVQAALAEIGEYKGRGKGGGHTPRARFGFMYAQHRAITNKFTPHQGKRECARRVRQMGVA